jgi:hypothetical protein
MIINYENDIFDSEKHTVCVGDLLIFTFNKAQVPILVLNVRKFLHLFDGKALDVQDCILFTLNDKAPWANLHCTIRNDI